MNLEQGRNGNVVRASSAGHSDTAGAVRKRLLIVDASTDPMLASLLSTAPEIARTGVECVAVRTAAEALAAVEKAEPVMIVLDPAVFSTSSGEFTRLRALAPSASLVLLANGDTHAENIETCYRAGADDCILRPFRAAHIATRLAAIVEKPGPDGEAKKRAGSGNRVLLVCMDKPCCRRLETFLELSGYHVLARPPEQASLTRLLETERPELVLLSPEGLGAAAWIRAAVGQNGRTPPPPLVALRRPEGGARPGVETWFDGDTLALEQVVARVHAFFRHGSDHLRVPNRVPFFCPVELREIGEREAKWTSCYSYDLSPGGLFVKTLVPPRPRASVELKIYLTTARQVIEGTGVVAWSNVYSRRHAWSYPVGAGIQFLGMSPKRLAQLRELCAELSPSDAEAP